MAEVGNWHTRFGVKIALAAASGLCVWPALNIPPDSWVRSVAGEILPGLLFAAGVLFPYLRRDKFLWRRCLGLVVISVASFWSAAFVGASLYPSYNPWGTPPPEDTIPAYLAGSLLGATIVLAGARLIIPLKHTLKLVLAGLLAAIIGGVGFTLAERPGELFDYLPYMLWHSLMALAIHCAENWSSPIGEGK